MGNRSSYHQLTFIIIFQLMLETTSNLSINENQSESYVSKQQISLPVIGRRNHGEQIRNKSYEQKQKLVLPNIHKNRLATESPNSIKSDSKRKNHQQFAKAVRQKLDLVLGQMPEYQTAEQDMQNSEDEDFEEKINQNKEIIKRHRLKKEKENQNSPKNKRGNDELKQKLQKKLRNESMQIKKDKIIQNNSLKKRNLSKRTNQPKEKGGYYQSPGLIGESQKQIRLRDEYSSVKLNKNNHGDKLKKNKIERAKSYKKSVKPLLDINKSLNLFDGIQNILQNPHKKEAMKGPIGLTLMKARRDLEDKIRIINQKLGVEDSQQNNKKMLIKSMDLSSSERHWRKIQIGPQNVHTQNSSFEQELARISSLQEKNSLCFEKYLEHQKILLDLQMRQRTLTRKDHTNSH